MNWIKRTEKLPELRTQVIVKVTNNKANIAFLREDKNGKYFVIQTETSSYKEDAMHRVTHWAEIPEPPILLDTTEGI